jgi:hypothetical protein
MPTTRTFAYNTGSTFSGADQVGYVAAGTPTAGLTATGVTWRLGPDEDLGYVVAYPTSGPRTAGGGTEIISTNDIGYKRSLSKTDNSFIALSNQVGNQSFATLYAAKTWLNSNGYWTSWPGIVWSGLSLYLNPSSSMSYSGTGNTWYDLSGSGLSFNSYGSQTPFTTLGGASAFQFNDSGYWACTSNFNLVDLAGDCTLIMWIYNTDVPHNSRRTIFQKNGTIYAPYEQEIAVTWESATDLSWYSRYADYDYASTPAVDVGWTMMGIKMSTGKGTPCRTGFYSKNGGTWTNNYFCRSNNPIVPADAIIIGNGYSGVVQQGAIGMILCYNKMLSDAEILQNFNATKSIYGL